MSQIKRGQDGPTSLSPAVNCVIICSLVNTVLVADCYLPGPDLQSRLRGFFEFHRHQCFQCPVRHRMSGARREVAAVHRSDIQVH